MPITGWDKLTEAELLDYVCEWCGKDTMDVKHGIDDDWHAITLHGEFDQTIGLCSNCFMSAVQALAFGKEVMQDCQTHGSGRRIYVAVEAVGEQNELVNALVWPNTQLSAHAPSARRSSITYRAYPD